MGLDIDPPRRRHPAEFHRVDPRNRDRTTALIRGFRPTALVHLGVYEPYARSSPRSAAERTAVGHLGGGHRRGRRRPPRSHRRAVGHRGLRAPTRRARAPRRAGPPRSDQRRSVGSWCTSSGPASRRGLHAAAPVTCLRFAPLVGAALPEPARSVPAHAGGALRRPGRSAVLGAAPGGRGRRPAGRRARSPVDGPVNVVGAGCGHGVAGRSHGSPPPGPHLRPRAGARPGGSASWPARPCPTTSTSCWSAAARPTAAGAGELLGVRPARSTPDVIRELYAWAEVVQRGRPPRPRRRRDRRRGATSTPSTPTSSATTCPPSS